MKYSFFSLPNYTMEHCKARKCFINSSLPCPERFVGSLAKSRAKYNDFKPCTKPVFQEGFCKVCYGKDTRPDGNGNAVREHGKEGRKWERDGVFGEPYEFPTHKKEQESLWVEMIYTLHPEIKPQNNEDASQEVLEVSEEIKEEKITRKGVKKNVSPTEELLKLSNLFKENLLTEEEFKKAKAMVLNL